MSWMDTDVVLYLFNLCHLWFHYHIALSLLDLSDSSDFSDETIGVLFWQFLNYRWHGWTQILFFICLICAICGFYKHIAVLCWIILMKLSCARVLKS